MTLGNFIDGVNILKKYYTEPNGYHLGAEHDIIYVYGTDRPVEENDFNTLIGLGWFQPDVTTENEDGIQTFAEYDLDDSWMVYV